MIRCLDIALTTSPYTVSARLCWRATVSKANGEAPVELWKKKKQCGMTWVVAGEKQLAEEGESGEGCVDA